MRYELYESYYTDVLSLVIFKGNEVIAIYTPSDITEAEIDIKALAENEEIYHQWGRNCFTRDTVAEYMAEDGIEKYDKDGRSVDLDKYPWTLQELYDDIKTDSILLKNN